MILNHDLNININLLTTVRIMSSLQLEILHAALRKGTHPSNRTFFYLRKSKVTRDELPKPEVTIGIELSIPNYTPNIISVFRENTFL